MFFLGGVEKSCRISKSKTYTHSTFFSDRDSFRLPLRNFQRHPRQKRPNQGWHVLKHGVLKLLKQGHLPGGV